MKAKGLTLAVIVAITGALLVGAVPATADETQEHAFWRSLTTDDQFVVRGVISKAYPDMVPLGTWMVAFGFPQAQADKFMQAISFRFAQITGRDETGATWVIDMVFCYGLELASPENPCLNLDGKMYLFRLEPLIFVTGDPVADGRPVHTFWLRAFSETKRKVRWRW